jgi:hypothetical protein
MPKINSQWKAAQAALVEAAVHLDTVWEDIDSDNCDDSAIAYPKYLPSFPEFVNDLIAWRDATGTREDQNPGSPERPKGKRSPVDVIAAIRRGDATPVMGRAPIVVIAEIKDALKVALRAIDLASVDLGLALTHRPNAGKPEAWINYAVATIERDERNSEDTSVAFALPTAGDTGAIRPQTQGQGEAYAKDEE